MKTKVFILVLIILSVSQNVFSQYTQEWVARHNSAQGLSYIAVDNSGNVYVTGMTSWRYLTVKFNSNGNELWSAIYNSAYSNPFDFIHGIVLDSYGNPYVTGEAKGQTHFYMDYATIKYNANGNQSWVNIYNSPANDHDRASAIAVDKNDNIIVTGSSVSTCTNGTFTWNTIKYNSAGNEVWSSHFCGYTGYIIGGYAPPPVLAIDSSGNTIVAGYSDSAYLSNHGAIIIKYNQDGQELWVKQLPMTSASCLVAADNSDNIYFADYQNGFPYQGIEVIKFNSNGDELWKREYDNLNLKKISVDKWKNVYVAGSYSPPSGYVTIKYDSNGVQQWVVNDTIGKELRSMTTDDLGNVYETVKTVMNINSDFYTAKYNTNGIKLWSAKYNGPADSSDVANDIAIDNSGNIFVSGTSRGIGTATDLVVIKYSIITNSNNNNLEVVGFDLHQNYPNPFNPTTNINYQLPITNYVSLKVFDINGKLAATLVNEKQNAGTYSAEFNGSNSPSGIYYYKLEAGDFSQVRKMILIK